MRATTLIAAILSLGAARPERVGPVELLTPDARAADSSALIDTDMQRYQRVRWRVRTGKFAAAISELSFVDDPLAADLFLDRYALLRGQSFAAVGRHAEAKADFLRAIYASQTPAVNEAAVRGLITETKKLGQLAEERAYLDALIQRTAEEPEPPLLLERVETLIALGDLPLAREHAWEIIEGHHGPATFDAAMKLLSKVAKISKIEKRGVLTPADQVRAGIARAHYYGRLGRLGRAQSELTSLRRSVRAPELLIAVDLEIADILRAREKRTQAESVLEGVLKMRGVDPMRPAIALRYAHLAQDRYQYKRARELYADLIAAYPGTPEARAAALDVMQLEYEAREYAAAADRARAVDDLSGESLWLAGWSAYLAGRNEAAQDYFARLMADKSVDPELHDAAEYWTIRVTERAGRRDEALWKYRALATRRAIDYYGLLAQARLEKLGEPFAIAVPAMEPPPANPEEVLALMGPDRPVGVDRAIHLLRGNLRGEGAEELVAVLDHYRRNGHLLGATLTIELFCLFDREAWVFLLARNVAEGEGAQLNRRPEFWRILHYAYPTLFESEVGGASRKHQIDPLLVYAVMRTESLFRPDAVSPVGARGLMQLMPYTARWIGRMTPEARKHVGRYRAPESNVWLGSWYVKNLLERYDGNIVEAIGAYNAGPGAMDRWVREHPTLEADEIAERTPYLETRRYIRRALTSYLMYRKLYGAGEMSLVTGLTKYAQRVGG